MAESSLKIQSEKKGTATVIKLSGQIDASTAPNLSAELKKQVAGGNAKLVCDMAGVDYISSAGIGTLLAGLKDAKSGKGDLRLAGLTSEVKDVFDLLKFSALFSMTGSVPEALEGL